MFIDFSHLLQHRIDEASGFNFVTSLVKEYNRFEHFLRKAVLQFLTDLDLIKTMKERYF